MSEERSILEEINHSSVPDQLAVVDVPQSKGIDLGFLKAPTGEGAIGDYMEHPMNFNNSKGLARMLRGLTGLLGNLDLAIVDIGVGLLDLLKSNKKAVIKNDGNGVTHW